jgi:Abortive infection alpha
MSIENLTEPLNKALDFISDIIKPPIKEVSEILTDKVRFWRFKNQLNLIQKAEKYVKEKGFSPKKIPMKTLVPLLEYSSLEEEDSLKEMWVNLLVNAVDPTKENINQNVYIEILKQLVSIEAKILNFCYYNTKDSNEKIAAIQNFRHNYLSISKIKKEFINLSNKELYLIMENLTRLQLIEPKAPLQIGTGVVASYSTMLEHSSYRLTYLGSELIEQTH